MRLRLRLLDEAATWRELFEQAGWHVDWAEGANLCVSHARVASEADARRRLHAMGLLTSNRVRIEFCPAAWSPSQAGEGSK